MDAYQKNIQSVTLLAIVLTFIAILFVLFRMKRVELDYRYYEIGREIEQKLSERKILSAKKAELLSVKTLTNFANTYHLQRPSDEQVIIVP
jgi:hypothetical protein